MGDHRRLMPVAENGIDIEPERLCEPGYHIIGNSPRNFDSGGSGRKVMFPN